MAAVPVPPPGVGFGFPGAGVGGGLNVDFGGGIGVPGLGLLGGLPGWGGWGGPYIPVTPLGALEGFKGDLIVPIVSVGVALFLLVLIVLAVKYALAWKLSILEDLSAAKKFKREVGTAPAPQLEDDYMAQLAKIVTTAIYSNSCSDRMICEVGTLARGNAATLRGVIALVESYIPANYRSYLDIMKSSAEGSFDCAAKYQCNQQQQQGQPGSTNKDSSAKTSSAAQPVTPRPFLRDLLNIPSSDNSTFTNATSEARQPQKPGKFRRFI